MPKQDKERYAGWKLKREGNKGKNGSWGMVQGYPQSTLLAVAASRTKDKGGPTLSSMPTLRYLPYTLFWDTIRSACGSNGSHVFYVRIQLSSQWESVSLTPLLNLPSLPFSPPGFSTVLVTLSLDLCSVCCPPFAPFRFSLRFCVFLCSLSPTFSPSFASLRDCVSSSRCFAAPSENHPPRASF